MVDFWVREWVLAQKLHDVFPRLPAFLAPATQCPFQHLNDLLVELAE